MIPFETQNNSNKNLKVLLLSAHTDDVEFGMGATISRLVKSGADVHLLVFCNAWQSLPAGFPRDTLITEQYNAAKVLGIPHQNIYFEDIPVRHFPQHRQMILERLISIKNELEPDIVFCPSLQDIHQDHATLATEAQRAFKHTTLLGFIFPWNIHTEVRHLFVEVEDYHLEMKHKAIKCFESQSSRSYGRDDNITLQPKLGGMIAGRNTAEMFEMIRGVVPIIR